MSGSVALFATGEHEFDLDAAAEWAKDVGGAGRWRSATKNDDDIDPEDEVLDDDLDEEDLDEDDEFDDPEELDADEDELDEDALEDDDELDDLDDDLIDLDDEYDDSEDEDRGIGGHKYVE